MANNVTILDYLGNPVVILTEQTGGASGPHAQRTKLVWGATGVQTDASAAAPLPVVQTGALPALTAGSAVIGGVTQSGAWTSRLLDAAGNAITSTSGAVDVNVKTSAVGSAVATESGTVTLGQTNVTLVQMLPYSFTGVDYTRAGAIPYQSDDLDETFEQIKATACIVYGFSWVNMHATLWRYIKWYNHASPTVGGGSPTVPAYKTWMKPNTEGHLWCGPPGIGFPIALSVACTTGFADSDVGPPGTNEISLTVWRK
jgi:hypothetical protein